LLDLQKPKKKFNQRDNEASRQAILNFFQKQKSIGDEKSDISDDTLKEVIELRQNYFKVYDFICDILPLVRVAAEDIH
jgi:hypothetical protein